METQKTLQILKTLADGIDPATGEAFSAGSAYQHPDTVRALFSAIRLLEDGAPAPAPSALARQPAAPATAKSAPENSGRPWSEEEDARLGQSHDAGKSIDELAGLHKRSKWAIEARLARLGKIPAPPTRFPVRNKAGSAAAA
ncbi:MAG TPA: hypothetical protein VHB46_05200 [Burkholderiales bacterium]|nr:hypothetical protein [Burkholderiales bacterium]